MPFKDKAKQAAALKRISRRRLRLGRTCATCGERPAERHHKVSPRVIVMCNPCHDAIVPMMSPGASPACCNLQAEKQEPEAVSVG